MPTGLTECLFNDKNCTLKDFMKVSLTQCFYNSSIDDFKNNDGKKYIKQLTDNEYNTDYYNKVLNELKTKKDYINSVTPEELVKERTIKINNDIIKYNDIIKKNTDIINKATDWIKRLKSAGIIHLYMQYDSEFIINSFNKFSDLIVDQLELAIDECNSDIKYYTGKIDELEKYLITITNDPSILVKDELKKIEDSYKRNERFYNDSIKFNSKQIKSLETYFDIINKF